MDLVANNPTNRRWMLWYKRWNGCGSAAGSISEGVSVRWALKKRCFLEKDTDNWVLSVG